MAHTGSLTLLEILEIYWNYFFLLEILEIYWKLLEIYKVSWKFSGLVREFVHLSLIVVTIIVFSECISTKKLAVNQDQLIFRLVIPDKCQLTHQLIGKTCKVY